MKNTILFFAILFASTTSATAQNKATAKKDSLIDAQRNEISNLKSTVWRLNEDKTDSAIEFSNRLEAVTVFAKRKIDTASLIAVNAQHVADSLHLVIVDSLEDADDITLPDGQYMCNDVPECKPVMQVVKAYILTSEKLPDAGAAESYDQLSALNEIIKRLHPKQLAQLYQDITDYDKVMRNKKLTKRKARKAWKARSPIVDQIMDKMEMRKDFILSNQKIWKLYGKDITKVKLYFKQVGWVD